MVFANTKDYREESRLTTDHDSGKGNDKINEIVLQYGTRSQIAERSEFFCFLQFLEKVQWIN
jgi:hypothetical protein